MYYVELTNHIELLKYLVIYIQKSISIYKNLYPKIDKVLFRLPNISINLYDL